MKTVVELRKKATLNDLEMVVRDANGRIRWLETNDKSAGMRKIRTAHGRDIFNKYDTVSTEDDIREIIYTAIRNSDDPGVVTKPNDGGGTVYLVKVEADKDPIRIAVSENGFIINAFPDSTTGAFE